MKKKLEPHQEATSWFNDLYERNRNAHYNIPWARRAVNPLLQSYLDSSQSHKGKALVVGCGLGDDAKALESAGYDVVAIDVSAAAIELAQERFKDSSISFEVQDIFDMPKKYIGAFDFIFEALTIQSLPVEFREKMIGAISECMAPDGTILVVAHKKERNAGGPPWPLEIEDMRLFKKNNLKEILLEIVQEESHISSEKFRAIYKKEKAL